MKIKIQPKKYSILYVDPPWSFRNSGFDGSAARQYNTMSLDEMMNLNVEELMHDDSFCFMWTTAPIIAEGIDTTLMRSWGFEPKTIAFVWVKTYASGKPVTGMGFYTRSSVEYVLLGKRGRPERVSTNVAQLIETKETIPFKGIRRRHSEKPAEVRDRIVELAGDLPRLEMFSRHSVKGWDYHGNELI